MKKYLIIALLCSVSMGAYAAPSATPALDRTRASFEKTLEGMGVHDAVVNTIYHAAYQYTVNEVCSEAAASKRSVVNWSEVQYGVWAERFRMPRSTFDAYVRLMKDALTGSLRMSTETLAFCKAHQDITAKAKD